MHRRIRWDNTHCILELYLSSYNACSNYSFLLSFYSQPTNVSTSSPETAAAILSTVSFGGGTEDSTEDKPAQNVTDTSEPTSSPTSDPTSAPTNPTLAGAEIATIETLDITNTTDDGTDGDTDEWETTGGSDEDIQDMMDSTESTSSCSTECERVCSIFSEPRQAACKLCFDPCRSVGPPFPPDFCVELFPLGCPRRECPGACLFPNPPAVCICPTPAPTSQPTDSPTDTPTESPSK